MYVDSLDLERLRSFRKAHVDLHHPDRPVSPNTLPNVNLLLGDNGAGKTSILRAIALGVLGPVIQYSGYTPFRIVRRTATETEGDATIEVAILLHHQDAEELAVSDGAGLHLRTVIRRRGDFEMLAPKSDTDLVKAMYNDASTAFLVVGYGATRRVGGAGQASHEQSSKVRRMRYQRVAGLFEDDVPLVPLTRWLPELQSRNPGRFTQVVHLLNDLLDGKATFAAELEGSDYLFEHKGTKVPFPALSDGYRAYIGWIADLLYHVSTAVGSGEKLKETSGVVLVDEIDLHLHPEWQRTIVPTLSAVLPRLQFVFTTHSPLVAGTLQPGNILVMEEEDGSTVANKLSASIHGLNADQVLVSPYFGLHTTRAPGVHSTLIELSRKAGLGDRDAATAFMKQLVGEPPAPSVTTGPPQKKKIARPQPARKAVKGQVKKQAAPPRAVRRPRAK